MRSLSFFPVFYPSLPLYHSFFPHSPIWQKSALPQMRSAPDFQWTRQDGLAGVRQVKEPTVQAPNWMVRARHPLSGVEPVTRRKTADPPHLGQPGAGPRKPLPPTRLLPSSNGGAEETSGGEVHFPDVPNRPRATVRNSPADSLSSFSTKHLLSYYLQYFLSHVV